MSVVARILCPVDFSAASRHALDHAAALAVRHGARLTVLYVFATRPVMDLPPLRLEPRDEEHLGAELARLTAHLPPVALDLRVRAAESIADAIISEAAALPADLLVLGSHGRTGVARLLLGSVTERVMHAAPCPLLVVPPRAADADPAHPVACASVVCAVDFSAASREAVRLAQYLAGQPPHVTLLSVIEMPAGLQDVPLGPGLRLESLRAAAWADALQRLRVLAPDDAAGGVHTAVREGTVYREILRQAADQHADLIAMGAHGRGAVDTLLFGSNTARVARAATCPVLIAGGRTGGPS